MRVIVVGAGIVGLASAWALRRTGHEPVVYDQGPIPNPLASSFGRHRAIRVTYGAEAGYARMALDAFAAWERLWAELGTPHLVPTGQLVLGPPDDPWITHSLRDLDALGLAYERLEPAALRARFPHIAVRAHREAVHVPHAGALLADRIVSDLARRLRQSGVALHASTRVTDLEPEQARVHLDGGKVAEGDALLVAAGVWTTRLVPELASRLRPSRQTVLYVRPPAALEAAWRDGPVLTDVDTRAQRIFYALPAVAGTAAKIGDHGFTQGGDPDGDRSAGAQEIAAIRALARDTLVDADAYALLEARTCFYTVTADERFLALRIGRATIVSACSGHGFKFGALVGERTAATLAGEIPFEAYRAWLAGEGRV